MAFFDKLSQVAKNIGDMAGDTIETTKLNAQAAKENAQALEQVAKIGDFYYKQYLAGAELALEVQEFCQIAKAHYDAAATAQAEVDRIKAENEAAKAARAVPAAAPAPAAADGSVVCPGCGAQFPAGTKFCNNCGGKIETPAEPAAPAGVFCTGCGAQFPAGTKFCNNCGTAVG